MWERNYIDGGKHRDVMNKGKSYEGEEGQLLYVDEVEKEALNMKVIILGVQLGIYSHWYRKVEVVLEQKEAKLGYKQG